MANLLDLFSTDDYKKEKKGKKDAKSKDSKGGKKDTAVKGIRYPLPVRVFAGHIRCLLDAGEFSGKTVGEADVKKKIREQYPELAGIAFNLVKFNNPYTEQYEKNNCAPLSETENAGAEKTAEAPLDFASAEKKPAQDIPKEQEEFSDETGKSEKEAAAEFYEDDENAEDAEEMGEETEGAEESSDG